MVSMLDLPINLPTMKIVTSLKYQDSYLIIDKGL